MRSFLIAFTVIVTVRVLAAVLLPVADCDEVFNYFEPAHFLLTGYGKQTWEYASQFALRSWAFLWVYLSPAVVAYRLFDTTDRVVLYMTMRVSAAVVGGLVEAAFVTAATFRFGRTMWLPLLLFVTLAPGAQATSSFLPSSFAMICMYGAGAAWMTIDGMNHKGLDIIGAVVWPAITGALLGWPFAGLVAVPIGLDVLYRHGIVMPFVAAMQITLVLGGVMIAVDSQYYGRTTLSSWNIVVYNVFGAEGRGPELYGVEPWSFFFKNLALNFNVVFVLALSLPALLLLCPRPLPDPNADRTNASNNAPLKISREDAREIKAGRMAVPTVPQLEPTVPLTRLRALVYVSPFYLWFTFWLRVPHKEERFMAPAYPFLLLSAAISVHTLQHATNARVWTRRVFAVLQLVGLVVFTALSLSRIDAMYFNFGGLQRAAMDSRDWLHVEVPSSKESSRRPTLCLAADWYRFPSSFFLPMRWRYCFLNTTAFSGALPLDFDYDTKRPRLEMNDLNKEIPGQYCAVSECDAVMDSLPPGSGDVYSIADGAIPSTSITEFPHGHSLLDAGSSGFLCRAFSFARHLGLNQCSWRRVVVGVVNKGVRSSIGI